MQLQAVVVHLVQDKMRYLQMQKIEREGELKNCWMTTGVSEPIYLGEII